MPVVEIGRMIAGRYRLDKQLGRGGMSVVWRADDEVLGRQVAVKVLSAELAGKPSLRDRIRDEARTAAGLRHPGIVSVFDYGEFAEDGRTLSYVVMELVDGCSLADRLAAGGALPWPEAVSVGARVAAALAAAHADGIVHRDVKPANVMVTSGGVKLVDFGISAAVGDLDGPGGELLGTPAYLAPERVEGSPVRPATDVYALGLLLYVAIAGRMPWDASTATQMLKAHVYTDPAPLPKVPGLPSEVGRILSRCLAKRPGDRPSAAEVRRALDETAADDGPTLPLQFARVRGRRPAAAGIAALLLAAGGGGWWLHDSVNTPAGAACAATQTCAAANTHQPASPSATAPTASPRPSAPPVKIEIVVQRTAQKARTTAAAAPAAHAPAGPAKAKDKAKGKSKAKPPKPK
ncbi:serine/threonine-protein kinase [Paractinoplanes rhizophilus]|jgi:serine/threonine-protein kinase|uniref:non-specific serine/threonine protein kinase n=1 Tax=Paractinoplanes rhizophilus TaxID=1416877 RepID=A0ABW2HNI0_9ACTN|nr:serine/threonine-protein kinase [Actinoplanes sp.]